MSKIENALQGLFSKHRIIFWYDTHREMREAFDEVWLVGVEKLEIKNNEFGLKHRILRQQPKTKFLLYHEGPQPEKHLDNWLLDVQLANGVFSADQISIWMSELGLGPEYRSLVEEHREFFRADSRREALGKREIKANSHHLLRLKMMAATLGASVEPTLENILFSLLDELATGNPDSHNALEKYGVLDYLWGDLKNVYGYDSPSPHIMDFAITLFESCYHSGLHEDAQLFPEAAIFLNHWQDSLKSRSSFETLSDRFSKDLQIKGDLNKRTLADLLPLDMFKVIDLRILELLMAGVIDRAITESQCQEIVHRRSSTYWYDANIAVMYQAVETAATLLARLRDFHFEIQSIPDGVHKYTKSWFQVDQLYREYVYYVRQSKQTTFFKKLNSMVEGHYNNTFLKPLNNNWQLVVDQTEKWGDAALGMQCHFYVDRVQPILDQNAKAAVIISDAMRYEVGEALSKRIQREGRFSANINAMLGSLPSYTQLGMAALLPNQDLEIQPNGTVTVDGISAAGTENRGKILSQRLPGDSRTLQAADVVEMTTEERRALFRDNRVVYVYHDQIDAVGNKLSDEGRTVDAVETTLNELADLIKMLANANFTKILVTADHGFLYQHETLDESDFAVTDISGEEIFSRNRRYVIGRGLQEVMSLKHFTAQEAGLAGEYEIMIAKSINRLRLSGASIRFVHGGASLQEIVIPVVSVFKERTEAADVRPVEVDKINGGSQKITTGQISVAFYQTEPISLKVSGRTLRAGIYAQDGTLLSDVHTLIFDFESANPRDREIVKRFQLVSAADNYNNQVVYLRLEELIPNTTKYKIVNQWPYQLDKTMFTLF